jgi:hypothetical protein
MRLGQRTARQAKKRQMKTFCSASIVSLPFYPNAGSQSVLFFDLLGYEMGEEKDLDVDDSLYPDWMIEEIEKYGHFGNRPKNKVYEAIPRNKKHEIDFICYTAGNGSGKTFTGGFFLYSRSVLSPNTRGLIMANSYPQLRDSTLTGIAEFCQRYNITLKVNKKGDNLSLLPPEEAAKKIAFNQGCWLNNKYHYVRSAEAFKGGTNKALQGGRGIGHVTDILWDEALRWSDESAFNTVLTRLRGKSAIKPVGLITSTLNTDRGKGGWDDLIFADSSRDEETKKRYVEINGLTHENRHNNDPDYVPRMKFAYTDELYKLEVLGIRTTVTEGKICKYFSRDKHVFQLDYDPTYPIYLSHDFNVNPMSAIACQWIKGELIVIQEFCLKNSNSFEMGEAVYQWLSQINPVKVYLHGDATGGNKTANSRRSNWDIIRDSLKSYHPIVCYGSVNPSVQDSINGLNCSFKQDKIFIDKKCVELIKDLEFMQYNNNNEPDKKTDPSRSHWFDCLRYISHGLMPYNRTINQNYIPPSGGGVLA